MTHIPGVINASELFTKELHDTAHFYHCCDAVMVSKASFDCWCHVTPSHMQYNDNLLYYTIQEAVPLDSAQIQLAAPAV